MLFLFRHLSNFLSDFRGGRRSASSLAFISFFIMLEAARTYSFTLALSDPMFAVSDDFLTFALTVALSLLFFSLAGAQGRGLSSSLLLALK